MTKVLSRKSILQAHWFNVYETELKFPNGEKRIHRDTIRKPSVAIFPLDDNDNVYLIDQYRYLLEERILESASGMIDEDEDPLKAAKRELKEETGITADEWISIGIQASAASIATWNQHLFAAKNLHFGEQELEDSEDIKVVKLSLDEAVKKVLNGEINTASSISGILMIDKMRQEGKI